MVSDTIVIVLMCIMTTQPIKSEGKFTKLFEQADSVFNKEYKLDIEELKKASNEAVKIADEKTKDERERIMKPVINIVEVNKLLNHGYQRR